MKRPNHRVMLSALWICLAVPALAESAVNPEIRMMGRCADCVLSAGDFTQARLMGIDFTNATLTNLRFDGAALSIALFDRATLTDIRFDGADLRGASFVNTTLVNVSFAGANLRGAVFEGARLDGTDLNLGRLCKTQMPDDRMGNDHCD